MRHSAALVGLLSILFPLQAQNQPGRQGAVARLLTEPPLAPDELARLEVKVQTDPADLNSRQRLLAHYRDFAPTPPYDDAAKRAARLRHIVYFIEHQAAAVDSVSPLMYVFWSAGPYANESDHELVRNLWLRQADAVPGARLNAARFLFVEHKQEAEELLQRSLAAEPGNRRVGANLGFMYGMDILGLDSLSGELAASVASADRAAAAGRARSELENSADAGVLAGAALAIQNLSMRVARGGLVDPELFQYASGLMSRARALAPNDEAFRGPMPMIEYFEKARRVEEAKRVSESQRAPDRVRIGGSVQALKLVRRVDPGYPEEARSKGIAGEVRFEAVIGRDGTVASLQVLSGHPLLIPLAQDAVRQWRYQPTLLNGVPVEVITQIAVPFPPAPDR